MNPNYCLPQRRLQIAHCFLHAHTDQSCPSHAVCHDEQTVDEDRVIASFVKAVRSQAGQAGGSALEDDDGGQDYEHNDVY
jgi:hypothetical protein